MRLSKTNRASIDRSNNKRRQPDNNNIHLAGKYGPYPFNGVKTTITFFSSFSVNVHAVECDNET